MSKTRILIGEDDVNVLKMTKVRLEYEGYEVIPAVDGAEVLERAHDELPIHLILLDIRLPKMNGYDVCRALKRQPTTADIPVIIFTGSESEQQRLADQCVEVGATDWVRKPFRTGELLAKIQQALGEKEGNDG